MQMKLINLVLKNFKGIKHFELNTIGGNADIFGDNATGKTTVYDAFLWLLFDKDSQNKKDFAIKTLDEQGNVIHGLEHEVEGTFDVNGKRLSLRKVYAEKWTKKRGSVHQEFTGNTTDYFINDVPVKKSEYTDKIESIAKEDIFKLLTSPTYFNEQLHWQDRRKILLEVCGDIADQDVIALNEKLSVLASVLGERSIDEHKKVIASRRKKINEELEKIPVRIDEINHNLPDISGLNQNEITSEISTLKEQIQLKNDEITRIRNGGQIAEKQKQIREIESEMIAVKNELTQATNAKLQTKQRELSEINSKILDLDNQQIAKQRSIGNIENEIKIASEKREKLVAKWSEIDSEVFSHCQDENCATCGQALPSEQIQLAKEKAVAIFNKSKSERLEAVEGEGLAAKNQIEKLEKQLDTEKFQIATLQGTITKLNKDREPLQAEIESIKEQANEAAHDSRLIELNEQIEVLKVEIVELNTSVDAELAKVRSEIAELEGKKCDFESDLMKFEQVKSATKRIDELKAEERNLAEEFEKLEHELYLVEEFTRVKVAMLDEKINKKFKLARFKMFETQVNGGLQEVCETLYNGVPYSSGLNNAARINVGIDIINTLSQHYGFNAPIFIDNRESVTKLAESNSQLISLIVSGLDKKLRVETENRDMREAV
ncbi:hypothetical protein BHU72_11860 [Desulfuribacillus stibiiarsenatis]|uniref:Nuclease SbcCD subunit C n=1 Tax=Desulfuribacillus stibiiarsenatis TaxID=1390249 RepID=A0A1E5L877_9FIRM|nr:AAA family ATPase [Desulfuribacillus stibiiarsenatis]OEH86224.1 hypothetical protein BHU72_11860 [Desulfuribacillus stibiiarsenatis]